MLSPKRLQTQYPQQRISVGEKFRQDVCTISKLVSETSWTMNNFSFYNNSVFGEVLYSLFAVEKYNFI